MPGLFAEIEADATVEEPRRTPHADAEVICGECLEVMRGMEDNSVDLVVADPPYGTTACSWDSVIPLGEMWRQLKRVTKSRSAIVMTASQPFTSVLACSNLSWFRYCWVWDKRIPSGFNYARFQPMRQHEDVLVFYDKAPKYKPDGEAYRTPMQYKPAATPSDSSHMTHSLDRNEVLTATHRKKRSIIRFDKVRRGQHPTQKPIELMRFLIETYSDEGDTVLDFTAGSGTTGVAAVRSGRRFVGIELSPEYCDVARDRIAKAAAER